MRQIEAAPLLIAQRKCLSLPLAKLHERFLAYGRSQPSRFG